MVEWFEILEAALQSGRYYLIPRSSQEEYRRPLDQTLGIYDNHFYFINGRVASELYAEVHPEFPRRAFYSVLMAAGIMPPEPARELFREGAACRDRHEGVSLRQTDPAPAADPEKLPCGVDHDRRVHKVFPE